MPRVHPPARVEMLERLVLQPLGTHPQQLPGAKQRVPVGRHQMRPALTVEDKPVKP